jgi:hypothetical protein
LASSSYSLRAQQLLHILLYGGHGTQTEFPFSTASRSGVRKPGAVGPVTILVTPSETGSAESQSLSVQTRKAPVTAAGRSRPAQFFRQRDGENNTSRGVVTLTSIHQTRQAFDIAEVQLVKAVFTACPGVRIRQSSGTRWWRSRKVVTFTARYITAAKEEDDAVFHGSPNQSGYRLPSSV